MKYNLVVQLLLMHGSIEIDGCCSSGGEVTGGNATMNSRVYCTSIAGMLVMSHALIDWLPLNDTVQEVVINEGFGIASQHTRNA